MRSQHQQQASTYTHHPHRLRKSLFHVLWMPECFGAWPVCYATRLCVRHTQFLGRDSLQVTVTRSYTCRGTLCVLFAHNCGVPTKAARENVTRPIRYKRCYFFSSPTVDAAVALQEQICSTYNNNNSITWTLSMVFSTMKHNNNNFYVYQMVSSRAVAVSKSPYETYVDDE